MCLRHKVCISVSRPDGGKQSIYETPYDFGSSTYSNAYMRMSGTDTNYEPYIECVFSGSTAVG